MFNPLLMIDFYKSTHHEQYPVGLTKMVSYYTPRMSRLKDVDKVTLFGLQAFIKEYLIEGFNDNFFNRPEEEVVAEYERVLNATLGPVPFSLKRLEICIGSAISRWKSLLSLKAPELRSASRRSRLPTLTLTSFGW